MSNIFFLTTFCSMTSNYRVHFKVVFLRENYRVHFKVIFLREKKHMKKKATLRKKVLEDNQDFYIIYDFLMGVKYPVLLLNTI